VIPERTGLLVPSGDVAARAAAVERIMRDPAFAMQLSRNIADAASHEFYWRHTAEALLRTYERVARQDRPITRGVGYIACIGERCDA
jgi:glycosyltransferase involved in cell wall biosynthesis